MRAPHRAASPRNLTAIFAGVLLVASSGCVCKSPLGSRTVVPMPPSGEDRAALAIDCERACGTQLGCERVVTGNGIPAIQCGNFEAIHSCGGAGRRPSGLVRRGRVRRAPRTRRARTSALLAEMAHLEAASVIAFDELAAELEALGAPIELVDRARIASCDETRHAKLIGAYARRAGARTRQVRARPALARALVDLAIENAVEGCAFETFAALIALRQSQMATDLGFRRAMRSVAADEASHAELAYAIDAWARRGLGAEETSALDAAHRLAWERLATPRAALEEPRLGLPSGVVRARLACALGGLLLEGVST